MTSPLRRAYQSKRPRFARFIAHCIVRRTLRSVHELTPSTPPMIGLLGEGEVLSEEIEEALQLLWLPNANLLNNVFASDLMTFLKCDPTATRSRRHSSNIDADFQEGLDRGHAIFALAGEEADFPNFFRKLADRIVPLERPSARQIRAGFAYCSGIILSEEDAERLATLSLKDLLLVASRKGAWKKTLKALTDDAKTRTNSSSADVLSLNTLAGFGRAKVWGEDLARDLQDWRFGKLLWSDVDRGVLLTGAPGTGKTTYARALANTCGVHLVATSLAQWQSAGHLGDLLKEMRKSFAEARAKTPAILFLDEFDSVGNRSTARGDNASYVIETINGLLECLDGIGNREGIVVIGACNHPDLVDPAFLRPGRLEQTIYIPLPDAQAREQILRWHLKGDLAQEDLTSVAANLHRKTGADIEMLVRTARRHARKERRPLSCLDLIDAMPERIVVPEDELRRTAVHEAGHAVVQALIGESEIVKVEIFPELSKERANQDAGYMQLEAPLPTARTRKSYESQLAVLLSGIAAEEMVYGERSDAGSGNVNSDLALATQTATELEASCGLGKGLAQLMPVGSQRAADLLVADKALREKVEGTLAKAKKQAKTLLEENKTVHLRLVERLMTKHQLNGEEVRTLVVSITSLREAAPSDLESTPIWNATQRTRGTG